MTWHFRGQDKVDHVQKTLSEGGNIEELVREHWDIAKKEVFAEMNQLQFSQPPTA